MPQINIATVMQLCVLLSTLPAQYFISQWYGTDSTQRLHETERNWYYGDKRTQSGEDEEEIHDYFAKSTHIRSPKPESVLFNVGQVIVHRRFGYSGVIVGWDVKARAPKDWLQHKYPPEKQGLRDTPHYRILINRANRFGKSTVYIPEEEITIIMGLEVHHPDLTAYFSRYDGSKYIMQPWLRKIYPHD
ncbi:F-box only protein 21-like isoform X2 [Emydura macquarii macquarii]|uniref:F-box only protein 21-like isoform X2 n=1 Tax=Emydura macquarii macquarii TaxID=1129001 RepID=UPI003529F49C